MPWELGQGHGGWVAPVLLRHPLFLKIIRADLSNNTQSVVADGNLNSRNRVPTDESPPTS